MANIELIKELTSAFGPSGFEDDVVEVIKKHATFLNVTVDPMNNVYLSLKSNTGKRPIVMLDAHSDEVGFMVQYINSKGLIGFINIGGWVTSNIPAHKVKIKNHRGELITGIITSKPPHFMTSAERASEKIDIESLLIDIGATSREEVTELFGIQVGDPVVPAVSFEYNEKNRIMCGKAFDNRLGCMCVLETLNAIKDLPLQVDVIGCIATQEEVGMRGAKVTAETVKPDLAIVFEGSPADDIYFDKFTSQCALKQGTQIRHFDQSYISNPRFISYAKTLAEDKGIKYQVAVRRGGSTNAGPIHLTEKATPVLVLGIPSRYVHTHYNYCAEEDIDSTMQLAFEVIENFSENQIQKILNIQGF